MGSETYSDTPSVEHHIVNIRSDTSTLLVFFPVKTLAFVPALLSSKIVLFILEGLKKLELEPVSKERDFTFLL